MTCFCKTGYREPVSYTHLEKILMKKCIRAVSGGTKAELNVEVTNTDRTFGTILGAEITRQNPAGLPDDSIVINCKGAGGQSFGAFIPKRCV